MSDDLPAGKESGTPSPSPASPAPPSGDGGAPKLSAKERMKIPRQKMPEQEALVRATVHSGMLGDWRESEAGSVRFRLFEHEYEIPVEQEDKRIAVNTVMRSLKNFFRTETLREAFAVGRSRWLALEDLVSFHVGDVEVFLRMDLAFRDRDGRVVIVDWKTGRSEGRFNEIVLLSYHYGNQVAGDYICDRMVQAGWEVDEARVYAAHYRMTFDFLLLQSRTRPPCYRRLPELMGWG